MSTVVRVGRRRAGQVQTAAQEVVDLTAEGSQATSTKKRRRAATGLETPCATAGKQKLDSAGKKPRREKEEHEEKRVDVHGYPVRFSKTPNQKTRERIERAMPGSAHRLFLIDTAQIANLESSNGPSQEFTILGAVGNVYTVVISRHPTCSCPDFAKGNLCKHILFVMLRVLKLEPTNPLVWQRAYLTSEVRNILANASVTDQTVLASSRIRQKYTEVKYGGTPGGSSQQSKQRPVEGDCPICCEDLGGGEKVVFCDECGNNIHQVCFDKWASTKRSKGDPVTCVYCRAPWTSLVQGPGAESTKFGNQYLNLSQFSEEHQHTSLNELYGDRAVWIAANNGSISRRTAARLYHM